MLWALSGHPQRCVEALAAPVPGGGCLRRLPRRSETRCHVRDSITERDIVFGGRYDNAKELAHVEKHLRPGCVFVDVGANCGLFSLVAAERVGETGRVIAVEPNPLMIERLRFNISANPFRNIDVAECAVSDLVGTAEFQVCAADMGRSGLNTGLSGPRVTVAVRTLQDLLQGFGMAHVDVMKVDVEGSEDRVVMPLLRAAPKSLWPHAILIETTRLFVARRLYPRHAKRRLPGRVEGQG